MANTEKEQQHQEGLRRIRGFRLMDDDFMNACFDGNIEGVELLLKIIMGKDLSVSRVKTQQVMKNLLGRDIWLDIAATDTNGTEFDIEVQRADKGADRKRARYHSSIMDAHLLKPNQDFKDLPETYVIFITENDVLGDGEPLYSIERQITNTGKPFDDGEHIIYVNGENKDSSTELGKLMHDFFCTDPDDMYYDKLAEKVRYFKEDQEGVKTMCKVMEDMRAEAINKDRKNNAEKMLADGLSVEKVAEYSGLSVEQVQALAELKPA